MSHEDRIEAIFAIASEKDQFKRIDLAAKACDITRKAAVHWDMRHVGAALWFGLGFITAALLMLYGAS